MQKSFRAMNSLQPFLGEAGSHDAEVAVEQTLDELAFSARCNQNGPWPHFDYAHALEKAGRWRRQGGRRKR